MPRPTRPASTTRYALWLSRRPDDVRTLAALLCPTLPFAALATRALGLPVSSDDPYAYAPQQLASVERLLLRQRDAQEAERVHRQAQHIASRTPEQLHRDALDWLGQ